MGWSSPYYSIDEVINEDIRYLNKEWECVGVKKHKTYYHMMVQNKKTKQYSMLYAIYNPKTLAYKDIAYWDSMHIKRAPKNWLNLVYDYEKDHIKKAIDDYRTYQKEKRKAPKLDDILKAGKLYKIHGYNCGECTAKFLYKHKRSHIFELNGRPTRFVKLTPEKVEEIA